MAAVAIGADAGDVHHASFDFLLGLLAQFQPRGADLGRDFGVLGRLVAFGAHAVDLVFPVGDVGRRGADVLILHVRGAGAVALDAPALGLGVDDGQRFFGKRKVADVAHVVGLDAVVRLRRRFGRPERSTPAAIADKGLCGSDLMADWARFDDGHERVSRR